MKVAVLLIAALLFLPSSLYALPSDVYIKAFKRLVCPNDSFCDMIPMEEPVLKNLKCPFYKSEGHLTGRNLSRLLRNTSHVVFTFDDGPNPVSTPIILDILKKHRIRAGFFVLGLQAEKYPEIIKRIHDEGHVIGNHTYRHKHLNRLTEEKAVREIHELNELIRTITGDTPKYLRPPYGEGASNKYLHKLADEEGLKLFLWTIDPMDWKSRDPEKIIHSVSEQLGLYDGEPRGGVVLMHDIYTSTAESLERVIALTRDAGFEITAPDELLNRPLKKAPERRRKYNANEVFHNIFFSEENSHWFYGALRAYGRREFIDYFKIFFDNVIRKKTERFGKIQNISHRLTLY